MHFSSLTPYLDKTRLFIYYSPVLSLLISFITRLKYILRLFLIFWEFGNQYGGVTQLLANSKKTHLFIYRHAAGLHRILMYVLLYMICLPIQLTSELCTETRYMYGLKSSAVLLFRLMNYFLNWTFAALQIKSVSMILLL